MERAPEELEAEYWSLMEESFVLKHHGGISLAEQAIMTAEDRKWWIKRIADEAEAQRRAASGNKVEHQPGQSIT